MKTVVNTNDFFSVILALHNSFDKQSSRDCDVTDNNKSADMEITADTNGRYKSSGGKWGAGSGGKLAAE